ncbi:MAG: TetR/AcrR family transcriptional regulator [Ruminococcaceae bacterium]|jgi:AcrR family transcriptional regulator|nr:TetR/AcrR family transcriptional regulator [Oscillospiraceae bacterium]
MSEDRRIRKTKSNIKSSLIELLKDKPINNISVTELTELADISRKTFYLHYNSIYEAKEDIDNDLITQLNEIISSISKESHSLNTYDIYSFFKQVNKITENHSELVSYFISNTKQSSLYMKVKQILKDSILEWVNRNSNNPVYNDYLAEFVVSGVLSTYVQWNNRNKDIPDNELNDMLTKLCSAAKELVK